MRTASAVVSLFLLAALPAQGEEAFLAFRKDADAAFTEAKKANRRVLVYQDWPG